MNKPYKKEIRYFFDIKTEEYGYATFHIDESDLDYGVIKIEPELMLFHYFDTFCITEDNEIWKIKDSDRKNLTEHDIKAIEQFFNTNGLPNKNNTEN